MDIETKKELNKSTFTYEDITADRANEYYCDGYDVICDADCFVVEIRPTYNRR